MAVRVEHVNLDDLNLADMVRSYDPFQLSALRLHQVWAMLPPETLNTIPLVEPNRTLERTLMAIRTVEATAAPQRLFKRGGISSKQDYIDLLAALNNAKPNQALIVDMDPKAWVDEHGQPLKKPEVIFANSLRRRFEMSGLAITAYMSGNLQVTVRRLTALEIKEKEANKGKKGRKSSK